MFHSYLLLYVYILIQQRVRTEKTELKSGNSIKSDICLCYYDVMLTLCPPEAPLCNDNTTTEVRKWQCDSINDYQNCAACPRGDVAVYSGDNIKQLYPRFHIASIVLGEDCRLWNGENFISMASMTETVEEFLIDWNSSLICNCSVLYNAMYSTTKDNSIPGSEVPASTTPIISNTDDIPTPQPGHIIRDMIIVFATLCGIIISISIVYKYRTPIAIKLCGFILDNRDIIPAGDIAILRELNPGRFGIVELADWYPMGRYSRQSIKCVVKTAAGRSSVRYAANTSVVYIRMHHRELETLRKLRRIGQNPNIVQFYGVWRNESAIVLEFCEHGDLKSYVERSENRNSFVDVWNIIRELHNEPTNEILREKLRKAMESFSTLMLIKWCAEVAAGMDFLVLSNILQMDLAARNVLLTERFVAKITDFGLSRELDERYVRVGYDDEDWLPPLPWLAPEANETHIFSVKSSVYAFGVTVNEILCLGENLYPGVPANSLVATCGGYRLDTDPPFSTPSISGCLQQCWKTFPNERPSFAYLKVFFGGETDQLRLIMNTILNANLQVQNQAEVEREYIPANSRLLQSPAMMTELAVSIVNSG